jgi:hypothetical protein
MFETVDYLTTVVVDVSLEHKYFKENGDSFVTRVESLLEYIEEVRQCEQRQIYQTLSKQKPATVALLRVSEALSNGGTLLASLTRGLEHIAARGRNSTSAPLRKMISERIESTIAQHKKTVNEFEDRLRQVANRGRQAHWSPGRWEKHLNSPSGAQITVSGLPRGDEILVSAKIKMNESCHSGLLNLEGQAGKQQIVSTAFATTSAEDPMTLTAHMGSFSRDLSYDTLGGVFVPFEPPEPATTRMRDRRALLAVNENYQGGLDVKLYFEHQNCDACPHQIGSISSADTLELESWCEEQLAEVGTIVGRGDNFNARLRSIGVGLERRVLTGEGRNTLETCLSNIDTLVIASRSHNIPWEWLTLPQRSPGAPPLPLWEMLYGPSASPMTRRWHRCT